MGKRDERHPPGRVGTAPVRRHRGRKALLVLVVLALLVGVGQWRLDLTGRLRLADRLGLSGQDAGPAAVPAPTQLALPDQPAAAPVAVPVEGGRVDAAAVRRALAPYVSAKALPRRHLDVVVADLAGRVVYRHGDGPVTPASTTKLLTSTAALEVLGSSRRFATTVRRVPGTRRIVLVGGGDPFLASTPAAARGLYPARATTQRLAALTAAALHGQGVRSVGLGYDAGLFTGPAVNPTWPDTYLPEDVVPPISALWVDEAEGPDGRYVDDPAAAAAAVFARQLEADGIRVRGRPRSSGAPAGSALLASVRSAPVGEIVQRLITVSDNNAAEVLLRHVGLAARHDASFAGGTAAVRQVLQRLGVPVAGLHQYDGSGLSRQDRLEPHTLVGVLRAASSTAHPELREVITGLPVAGFSGSLARRFATAPHDGLGRVRVKTGTLTGVSGLAGLATDLTGTPMIVIAMADHLVLSRTEDARAALDRITAALGACTCAATGGAG
ncbi:MAG: D-alanyl-D-alanine carboxypeptidase/D-alanyl-D-alanine endopeptidase [Marmoricola sp.]